MNPLLIGLLILIVMRMLGEMATALPKLRCTSSGCSATAVPRSVKITPLALSSSASSWPTLAPSELDTGVAARESHSG